MIEDYEDATKKTIIKAIRIVLSRRRLDRKVDVYRTCRPEDSDLLWRVDLFDNNHQLKWWGTFDDPPCLVDEAWYVRQFQELIPEN